MQLSVQGGDPGPGWTGGGGHTELWVPWNILTPPWADPAGQQPLFPSLLPARSGRPCGAFLPSQHAPPNPAPDHRKLWPINITLMRDRLDFSQVILNSLLK